MVYHGAMTVTQLSENERPFIKECDQCGAKVDESWASEQCPKHFSEGSCDGTLRWLSNVWRVWFDDETPPSPVNALIIIADTAEEAAIQYAEQDCDGQGDGLYTNHGGMPVHLSHEGVPLQVWGPDGKVHRFKVGIVEFEPVFGAVEC